MEQNLVQNPDIKLEKKLIKQKIKKKLSPGPSFIKNTVRKVQLQSNLRAIKSLS